MADELRPEALIDKDGVKVSKSPWGPDDEIGRLNWLTHGLGEDDPRTARRPQGVRPERRLLHRDAVVDGGRRPEASTSG